VQSTRRMTVDELHDQWAGDPAAIQVLDVRERAEWDAGHIPGALHRPYHDLRDAPDGLALDRPVAVVCGSGQRAAVGASLLQRQGATGVIHVVDGGVPRWAREGWPIEAAPAPTATG